MGSAAPKKLRLLGQGSAGGIAQGRNHGLAAQRVRSSTNADQRLERQLLERTACVFGNNKAPKPVGPTPLHAKTATEAKSRFGKLCAQAKRAPVFADKAGLLDTVILSAENYQALRNGQDKAHRAAGKRAVEAEFGDWILDPNTRVEAHGIPGVDLRLW